jgi:ubiquinone/menaquinone biosynthesis C-methylase UbiE
MDDVSNTFEDWAALEPALAYDLAALQYDTWHWQRFWHGTETPFFNRAIKRHSADRFSNMLDVGCGTGFYLGRFEGRCQRATGVDPSDGMLRIADHWALKSKLLRGGLPQLPVGDESFDLTICARVLSHVEDLDAACTELRRVSDHGGLLLISNVDAGHPYRHTRMPAADGDDVYARTFKHRREDVFQMLEEDGFELLTVGLIMSDGEVLEFAGRDDGRKATAWALAARG